MSSADLAQAQEICQALLATVWCNSTTWTGTLSRRSGTAPAGSHANAAVGSSNRTVCGLARMRPAVEANDPTDMVFPGSTENIEEDRFVRHFTMVLLVLLEEAEKAVRRGQPGRPRSWRIGDRTVSGYSGSSAGGLLLQVLPSAKATRAPTSGSLSEGVTPKKNKADRMTRKCRQTQTAKVTTYMSLALVTAVK
jgi:hypothetical protein